MELRDFGEVEVKRQVLVLVLDGQVVVAAVVLRAVAERDTLPADLDVWVTSTSHHLHLQVVELFLL